MSTILEVLIDADYNIKNGFQCIGAAQLSNALYLITERGKGLRCEFDEHDLD